MNLFALLALLLATFGHSAEPPKARLSEEALKRFKEFGVSPASVFLPAEKLIPGRRLYHGTRDRQSLRSIVFDGPTMSNEGSAGAGVYSVDEGRLYLANARSRGSSGENLIVNFEVASDAKILDLTEGPGKLLRDAYQKKFPESNIDDFAKYFEADILRYEWLHGDFETAPAFVTKNTRVLTHATTEENLLPLKQISSTAKEAGARGDLPALMKLAVNNGLSDKDTSSALREFVAAHPPKSQALLAESLIAARAGESLPNVALSIPGAELTPLMGIDPSLDEILGAKIFPKYFKSASPQAEKIKALNAVLDNSESKTAIALAAEIGRDSDKLLAGTKPYLIRHAANTLKSELKKGVKLSERPEPEQRKIANALAILGKLDKENPQVSQAMKIIDWPYRYQGDPGYSRPILATLKEAVSDLSSSSQFARALPQLSSTAKSYLLRDLAGKAYGEPEPAVPSRCSQHFQSLKRLIFRK